MYRKKAIVRLPFFVFIEINYKDVKTRSYKGNH
jgi:hypothetical protein